MPEQLVARLAEPDQQRLAQLIDDKDVEGAKRLVADSLRAPCGHERTHCVEAVESRVTGWAGIEFTHVIRARCMDCTAGFCQYRYDGAADDMFNLNDTELFRHDYLIHHFYSIVHAGPPFNASLNLARQFVDTLPEGMRRYPPSLPICIEAFFSWLQLLPNSDHVECAVCGKFPSVLIGDGTGVKLFAEHMHGTSAFGSPSVSAACVSDPMHDVNPEPDSRFKAAESDGDAVNVHKFMTRKLIGDRKLRTLLEGYSAGRDPSTFLSPPDLTHLIKKLDEAGGSARVVGDLLLHGRSVGLDWPKATEDDGVCVAPPVLRHFLYHLSTSNSDVTLISTPAAYRLLLDVMTTRPNFDFRTKPGGTGDDLDANQEPPMAGAPPQAAANGGAAVVSEEEVLIFGANTLYRIFDAQRRRSRSSPLCIPEFMRPVVTCILKLYEHVIASSVADNSLAVAFERLDAPSREVCLSQDSISFYPHWPRTNGRPSYPSYEEGDGRSSKQFQSDYRKCDASANLHHSGQRKFNPGIFCVCCPHGVNYGFHFFKHHESPNDFFSLLLTRFPKDKLPKVVIYDNACKLVEYILNREPWMLQYIIFMVDAFHYGGCQETHIHKCPHAFDKSFQPAVSFINAQYQEHGNSFLNMFKSSLRTMSRGRAYQFIRMVLTEWNKGKSVGMSRKGADYVATARREIDRLCALLGSVSAA